MIHKDKLLSRGIINYFRYVYPEIIKSIVEALPEIITGIVNALTDPDNLALIIQAGIDLLIALVEAIPEIVIALVEAVPQIITGLVNALGEGFSRIFEVGKNLVSGLWEGIKSAASWLWNKIKEWATSIWDGIKSFFGISSPSKLFKETIGKNLVLGLADGITAYGDYAVDAMEEIAGEITDAANIDAGLDWDELSASTVNSTNRKGVSLVQNIYAQEMSPSEVFEEAINQQERWYFLGV